MAPFRLISLVFLLMRLVATIISYLAFSQQLSSIPLNNLTLIDPLPQGANSQPLDFSLCGLIDYFCARLVQDVCRDAARLICQDREKLISHTTYPNSQLLRRISKALLSLPRRNIITFAKII